MAVANLQTNLLDTLKSDVGVAGDEAEQIFLTPYLALACGLLYMMASDGELEAQEQGVVEQVQVVVVADAALHDAVEAPIAVAAVHRGAAARRFESGKGPPRILPSLP